MRKFIIIQEKKFELYNKRICLLEKVDRKKL